jgi:hypothetical protein
MAGREEPVGGEKVEEGLEAAEGGAAAASITLKP